MKIAVVGESAQDIFIRGYSDRQCPDTPAPVFTAQTQTENWGMAYNVLLNIKSILNHKYKKDKDEVILITNQKTREFITKTRYIIDRTNTTICRVDVGDKNYQHISEHYDDWKNSIKWNEYDVIIISDYNKNFLLEDDIKYITSQNNKVFIDTKKKLIGDWFKNVLFIKINHDEFDKSKQFLTDDVNDKIITTLGDEGALFQGKIYPVKKVDIRDVSGAGDTWFSAFVIEYMKTKDIEKSIKFGNRCATLVVQRKGVCVPFGNEI